MLSSPELEKPPEVLHNEAMDECNVNVRRAIRKVDKRILPFAAVLYLLSFLDRSNIGNAKIAGLSTELHLTGLQYNFCAAMFFVTSSLFEIPANVALKLMKPSHWIPLIAFCWACVMVSMAFVTNFAGLLTARLFLGVAEAGIFPGLIAYLCTWYPRLSLAQRVSLVSGATSLSGAFGGILAYGIENMDGIRGLSGWSWIFLLEGLFTACFAVSGFFLMHDRPESATFLDKDEQAWLVQKIRNDSAGLSKEFKWRFLWQALRDPHVYLMVGIYTCVVIPAYASALFTPTIVHDLGFTAANAQLLSIPPNLVAFLINILFGFLSDRHRMRGPFVLIAAMASLVGYVVLYATSSSGAGYTGLMIATCGVYPGASCTLAWAGNNFGGETKKMIAIAMVLGAGQLGAVVSSFVYRAQDSPRYHLGHAVIIGCSSVCVVLTIIAMLEFRRQNRMKIALCENQQITKDMASDYEEMGDASPLFRYTM